MVQLFLSSVQLGSGWGCGFSGSLSDSGLGSDRTRDTQPVD